MATKVLGQSAPSATTATDVYTVPSGKSTVISTIAVCNTGSLATYRISVRVNGASPATAQRIASDASLPANSSDFLTVGITLSAGDVITVYSSTANLAFNIFGDES